STSPTFFFFFVQAEDGIRDRNVTGVQTCALPISGHHWRQASPEQRDALVEAFKNTLIRTYSGALDKADQLSKIKVKSFRGDPNADDVVVRSLIEQRGNPDVARSEEHTSELQSRFDLVC